MILKNIAAVVRKKKKRPVPLAGVSHCVLLQSAAKEMGTLLYTSPPPSCRNCSNASRRDKVHQGFVECLLLCSHLKVLKRSKKKYSPPLAVDINFEVIFASSA